MESFPTILPSDVVRYLFTYFRTIDLVVQMFVCKRTKQVAGLRLKYRKSLKYLNLCTEAARWGYLPILKWLVQLSFNKPNITTCCMAAAKGDLKMIKWLCGRDSKLGTIQILEIASENNQYEIFGWLSAHYRFEINNVKTLIRIVSSAIKNAKLQLVKDLLSQKTYLKITCTYNGL